MYGGVRLCDRGLEFLFKTPPCPHQRPNTPTRLVGPIQSSLASPAGSDQIGLASTVSHFWLPTGSLQFTSVDQMLAPDSHSRSELSAQTRC